MKGLIFALIGAAVGSWLTGWLLYRHLHGQVKISQSMIRELRFRSERDFWRRQLLEYYGELVHFHETLRDCKQSGQLDPQGLQEAARGYRTSKAKAEFLFSADFRKSTETMAESFNVMIKAIYYHQNKAEGTRIDYDLDAIWEEADRRFGKVRQGLVTTIDNPLSFRPGERFQV